MGLPWVCQGGQPSGFSGLAADSTGDFPANSTARIVLDRIVSLLTAPAHCGERRTRGEIGLDACRSGKDQLMQAMLLQ
jgi:hypothetical protein